MFRDKYITYSLKYSLVSYLLRFFCIIIYNILLGEIITQPIWISKLYIMRNTDIGYIIHLIKYTNCFRLKYTLFVRIILKWPNNIGSFVAFKISLSQNVWLLRITVQAQYRNFLFSH